MSAFAAAMQVLIADTNLGTDATYRVGGAGSGAAIRVIRSKPDITASAFGARVLQATDVLDIAQSDLAAEPAEGDTVTIGSETLTVQHAEGDATGTSWRVYCQR